MTARRVALVVGTRPEATKVAPLHLALAGSDGWEPTLISTGQHGDHLAEALEPFDLKPDLTLPFERADGDLVTLNANLQANLAAVVDADRFDAIVVQGDTASTLAGALVAYWRRVPLVHLEAGLRTGVLDSPFPEEGNRRLVSTLADLHLAPTPGAADNLEREGVSPDAVRVVGNTSVDAVRWVVRRSQGFGFELPAGCRRHVLVTAHRRESWGAGIRRIGQAVGALARRNPDTAFLVATHLNPAVQADIRAEMGLARNVVVLPPMAYRPFVATLAAATLVLTDSGGVQEEAPALDVPVLVLRDTTERAEVVDAGGALVVGTATSAIVAATQRVLDDDAVRTAMAQAPCPFGDGRAAHRCVEAMSQRWSRR